MNKKFAILGNHLSSLKNQQYRITLIATNSSYNPFFLFFSIPVISVPTMSNDLGEILTTVCLIIEGRTPLYQLNNVPRSSRLMKALNPFYDEGPHCKLPSATSPFESHNCEKNQNPLCRTFRAVRKAVEMHVVGGGGFAVEVYLSPLCKKQLMLISQPDADDILIEAWHFQLQPKLSR